MPKASRLRFKGNATPAASYAGRLAGSVAKFLDGRASMELEAGCPYSLGELLNRIESWRELSFADHVDQFHACQDRCS